MTGLLRVAVCTNRLPAEAAECLAALRSQAPEGALALVASGLSAADAEAHRTAFGGTVLVGAPRGLVAGAQPRARMVQEDDALAFVDDDAVVADGWYDALARHWREADADVGCIGGPIRPRWPFEPPSWVSPPILPVLTLLDLGPEPRELDPATATVYGANVSFRVAPLRLAGGFDPGFGHSGSRVFFSEEDEAQRSLARLGYRTLYVPDAAVWHVIPVPSGSAAARS